MDVLKRLFSKDKEEDSRFKGQGHRLGSAAEHPTPAKSAGAGNTQSSSKASGFAQASATPPCNPAPGPKLVSTPAATPPRPAALQRVISGDGAVVVSNSPTAKEIRQLAGKPGFQHAKRPDAMEERSNSLMADVANRLPASFATISDPTLREGVSALSVSEHSGPVSSRASLDGTAGDVYAMQHSLALVLSHPQHAATLATLARILQNILANPFVSKYRQIRLSNAKVREELLPVAGAVQFLQACGFEFKFPDKAQSSSDGHAELPSTSALGPLETGWQELNGVMQSHDVPLPAKDSGTAPTALSTAALSTAATSGNCGDPGSGGAGKSSTSGAGGGTGAAGATAGASPASRAAAAAAVVVPDRETQVILPVAPDTEVPDWFFSLTGSELKAEYVRMQKERAEKERFMPRALRERAAASQAQPTTATIRIRFPEGVCLQGRFAAGEPVVSIHTWLCESLRSPAITYELVDPSRRPVQRDNTTVRSAGLAPSSLLNFRPTGSNVQDFAQGCSFLSDAQLKQVAAMY